MSLLLLLLTMLVIASAQTSRRRIYLDGNLNITSKAESRYTAFVTREAGHWIARASYRDGSPLLNISFKNTRFTVKDGHYTVYYPGGKPLQDGDFTLDRADGIWRSWYMNGRLKDSGRAVGNQLIGVWKYWYENGQLKSIHEYSRWHGKATEPVSRFPSEQRRDESDPRDDFERNEGIRYIPVLKPLVPTLHVTGNLDGQSQSWYENGQLESTGTYKDNIITGTWKWFRENGQPSSIETYSNGHITQLECYDENGSFTGNSCSISSEPVFTDSVFSIRYYILDQLKRMYNKPADIGRVAIMFTVTKRGKITRLVVLSARTPEVENYIKQLFVTLPAWLPAYSHNRAIDYPIECSLF